MQIRGLVVRRIENRREVRVFAAESCDNMEPIIFGRRAN